MHLSRPAASSATHTGRRAEDLVAAFIVERGATIVARNLRLGYLELDIVARDGPLVLVVEVRTRGPGSYESALGSIRHTKRERIRRAARLLWSRRYRSDPTVERLRIDVAVVDLSADPPHVEYIPAAL